MAYLDFRGPVDPRQPHRSAAKREHPALARLHMRRVVAGSATSRRRGWASHQGRGLPRRMTLAPRQQGRDESRRSSPDRPPLPPPRGGPLPCPRRSTQRPRSDRQRLVGAWQERPAVATPPRRLLPALAPVWIGLPVYTGPRRTACLTANRTTYRSTVRRERWPRLDGRWLRTRRRYPRRLPVPSRVAPGRGSPVGTRRMCRSSCRRPSELRANRQLGAHQHAVQVLSG